MNISLKNNINFENIDLIILNIAGTLVNYDELWLKQIGYISQCIAEKHSKYQGELFRIRAMVMKTLGVDPETGMIDWTGPFFSLNECELKLQVANILYLNNVNWIKANDSVDEVLARMLDEIDYKNYVSLFPESIEFLSKLQDKVNMITYSYNTLEKSDEIMNLFKLENFFQRHYSNNQLSLNYSNLVEKEFLSVLSEELSTPTENMLVIADSINDLKSFQSISNKIIINRKSLPAEFYKRYSINGLAGTLTEICVT